MSKRQGTKRPISATVGWTEPAAPPPPSPAPNNYQLPLSLEPSPNPAKKAKTEGTGRVTGTGAPGASVASSHIETPQQRTNSQHLGEAHDLLNAAAEAQALGRLKIASAYLLLLHARLVGLGKRFDRAITALPRPSRRVPATAAPTASPAQSQVTESSEAIALTATEKKDAEKKQHHSTNKDDTAVKLNFTPSKLAPQKDKVKVTKTTPKKTPDTPKQAVSKNNKEETLVQSSTATKVIDKAPPPPSPSVAAKLPAPEISTESQLCANSSSPEDGIPQTKTEDNPFSGSEAALRLASFIPKGIELDATMMEHLARAAMELHNKRTGKKDSDHSQLQSTDANTSSKNKSPLGGGRVAWSDEEHARCIAAAGKYGSDDTKEIATAVGTKTETQVRAHLRNASEKEKAAKPLDEELRTESPAIESTNDSTVTGATENGNITPRSAQTNAYTHFDARSLIAEGGKVNTVKEKKGEKMRQVELV